MEGIIIGVIAFLLIGLFHPVVIWCEYYFSSRCWPVFLAAGMICLAASAVVYHTIGSAALGIAGMSCLWSILELKEQEKRVAKGWFPKRQGKCKAALLLIEDKQRTGKEAASETEESIQNFD